MSTPQSSQGRRHFPGLWFLILLLLAGGALAWMWSSDPFGDQGMVNVFTMMIVTLVLAIGFLWFVIASGYRLMTRVKVVVALILLGFAGDVMFELHGFSGSMIPDVRWNPSWRAHTPVGDYEANLSERSIDLNTVTPDDWPAFMGADRTGSVQGMELERDWERQSPELEWKRPIGAGWSSFAVVGGVAVTQEELEERESLCAYDVDTGERLWLRSWGSSFDHPLGGPGPRATPVIAEGRVVALFAWGRLVCVEGSSGEIVWERDLLADYGITREAETATIAYGRSNSPLVHEGRVIVPVGGADDGAGLLAVQLSDGTTVWESPGRTPSYSSPMLGQLLGQEQLLIVNEESVSGHDPATGALLWEHPWPSHSEGDSSNSQPLIVGEDRVLVSRGYGAGSALIRLSIGEGESIETEELWHSRRSLRTKMTSAVQREGHAYGLSDGMLECIDLSTGKRVWKEGRYGHGQLLLVNDLLVLVSEEGELHLIEASPEGEGASLSSFDAIDGKTWNLLALYGDRLLVRNGEEAACVRLPRSATAN